MKMYERKRICLFAGYDKQDVIDDYVLYYLRKLSEFADIYVCFDNDLSAEELSKLDGIVKFAMAEKHNRYDFGSWAELIKKIGYEKIEKYDDVLLANDSCFAPMFDFQNVFEKMDARNLDVWGICGNKFMMSFFMNFSKKAAMHPGFRHFFANVKEEKNKALIVKKYEQGISRFIKKSGFSTGVYISKKDLQDFHRRNKADIKSKMKSIPLKARWLIRFRPNKLRLYSDDFILPFFMKMPLVKKASFLEKESIMPAFALEIIKQNSDYPVKMIEDHFNRLEIDIRRPLYKVVTIRIFRKIRYFIYDRKYRGDKMIIRFFNIPVYRKKMDYGIGED